MALAPGVRLGAYEIVALLGAGGMGEVYRARDTRLKREVAIKILPEAFAHDGDRLARFQREAELLATLNHPNIGAVFGLEQTEQSAGSGQTAFAIVLELIEGDTLADVLQRGPMPVERALNIARQIAEALEAAHEKGIVHRDLKPANIKITPEDKVKVLDFGLAKAFDQGSGTGDRGSGDASQSPTITTPPATAIGVIMGTAAYMSPEQAKGKAADARSDIWAFGVILYEMLTGKPGFDGETMVEILSGVLKTDPDWTGLPATTPPLVRSLIRRCLQKDRARRLRDIADARFQLEEVLNGPAGVAVVVPPARRSRERLLWMAAMLVAVIAASVMTAWYFRRAPAEAPEVRLQLNTPSGNPVAFAISPDGRTLVFQATTEGKTQLWLRPLESEVAQPLAGTENGAGPFWSPDSRSIGFFADQKLKRIDIAGGTAQTLADAPSGNVFGGTWGLEATILFGLAGTAPIYRVSSRGGARVEATRVEAPQQVGHRFPSFLPDNHHFLFFAAGTPEVQGVYLGALDSKETQRLFDADTAAVFAPPDSVLFVRQETLFAQRLDLRELKPVGDPFPVAERLAVNPAVSASVALSASMAGPLAYRTAVAQSRQLIWFDRSGRQTGTVGDPDTTVGTGVRLSPDGRTVALTRTVGGKGNVWLIETTRGVPRRFTFEGTADLGPTWSPDGSRIAFSSRRRGVINLYHKSVVASGTEEVLFESSENKNILDWSFDGRFILYLNQSPKTSTDLWALPLDGDRKPFPIVQTNFVETGGRFSPDTRWIAYHSNETGRNEIYVQPFPGPARNWKISTNGGAVPQWRGDGRELFYLAPDNRVMAVPVTLQTKSLTVEAGAPVALFATRTGSQFVALPDGERFLINTPLEDTVTSPITIVLNWTVGLEK